MPYRIPLRIALKPFRMRLYRVLPVQIGTHARNHAQASLLRGCAAVTEEIPVSQISSLPVKRNFRLVERQNPRNADERGVHFETYPVIGPFLDIQHHRVMLSHIQLAQPANLPLPRNLLGFHLLGRRHERTGDKRPARR